MDECCGSLVKIIYGDSLKSFNELQYIIVNQTTDQIALPVYGDSKKTQHIFRHFFNIVESPGLAFYISKPRSAQESLMEAVKTSVPVLIFLILLSSLSGILFWIVEWENISKIIGKPSIFLGFCEGFWWAFISMTTIGYGDIYPKTAIGRFIAIVWILIGVTLLSLFTATITSILTASALSDSTSISGNKIAVILDSEEYNYAVKRNAIPIAVQTIEELNQMINEGKAVGILLDSYVAGNYQNVLQKVRLVDVEAHSFTYGFVAGFDNMRIIQCVRNYIITKKDQLYLRVFSEIVPLRDNTKELEHSEQSSLIDFRSTDGKKFLIILGALIPLLFLIGVFIDFVLFRKYFSDNNDKIVKLQVIRMGMNQNIEQFKKSLRIFDRLD